MAKLTDYVREGFKRKRRPWDGGELPEWWSLATWAALAVVGGVLVLGVVTGDDRPANGQTPGSFTVQTIDPATIGANPTGGDPEGGTSAPAPSGSADFGADGPVEVALTGADGTTAVPAGARNVAMAAAQATAVGDWSGIPLAPMATAPKAPATPQGSVIGVVTVTDPAVTGTNTYLFTATVRHSPQRQPYLVQIYVERTAAGYAVRPR